MHQCAASHRGFGVKLSDRLSAIAIAIDSATAGADRLGRRRNVLTSLKHGCATCSAALYLRSTMAQIDALLRGDAVRHGAD